MRKVNQRTRETLEAFSKSELVLVPNFRLARTWQPLLNEYLAEKGNAVFHEIPIKPIAVFLEELFLTHYPDCKVLNSLQEATLWQSVTQKITTHFPLLHVSHFAKLCQDAYKRLRAAGIDLHDERLRDGDDSQLFLQIAHEIIAELEARAACFVADIPFRLLKNGSEIQYKKIVIYGQIEESKVAQILFSNWQDLGASVTHLNPKPLKNQPHSFRKMSFENQNSEFETALSWAHSLWQENAEASVAVIIENLEDHKDRVQAKLQECFDLQEKNKWHFELNTPYDISAGKILSSCPVIETALLALQFITEGLPFESLSFLLGSPYWKGAALDKEIAFLELALRDEGKVFWQLSELQLFLKRQGQLPILFQTLSAIQNPPVMATPVTWIYFWKDALNALGFPGPSGLISEEYQALNRWLQEMKCWTSVSWNAAEWTAKEALDSLIKDTATIVFQTKTPQVRLSVLGPLEAVGMPFDFIWLTGMSDTSWPSKAKPHPLIPVQLQKELNMPQSSAEYETQYAEKKLEWILNSAESVQASYVEKDNEILLQPSPLIVKWPNENVVRTHKSPEEKKNLRLIPYQDDEGLPLSGRVKGGSYFLEAAAECPFKAYARYRLKVEPLMTVERQLSPIDRGVVIHAVLEAFWQNQDFSRLFFKSGWDGICQLVQNLIDETIQNYFGVRSNYFSKSFWILEKACLESLLKNYFLLESTRKPFEVVSVEKSIALSIDGLELVVRCDRIDKTEDNEHIVVDYKTGKSTITGWFNERLTKPQLPLYALFLKQQPDALMIIQIHYQETAFKGVGLEEGIAEGIKPWKKMVREASSWQEVFTDWQEKINCLVAEMKTGWAKADPYSPAACAFCDYSSLCRYHME